MSRVVVAGGRSFSDAKFVNEALDAVHRRDPIEVVINGGASGADALARAWAYKKAIPCETEMADWKAHGRAAGPIRNTLMLEKHKPTLAVIFPGAYGTKDLLSKAIKSGIKIINLGDQA